MKTHENRLSQLIFQLYHSSNSTPGRTSPVSDRMANRLADDADLVHDLMSAMLHCHGMPESAEIQAVVCRAKPMTPFVDQLREILNRFRKPLIDEDDDIDPQVLWERAWGVLGGDEADVSFDRSYIGSGPEDVRPAIHGHGIDIHTVNGAIVQVMIDAGLVERLSECEAYFANTQDKDDWVYRA